MKKFLISLALAVVLVLSSATCAFAAVPSKDGIYQVPIQIRSADSDSQAEQGDYFYNAALLEINGSEKYLTMASISSIAGFTLYYYTDGSVTGSTQTAEKVRNIEIGSRTYPSGYRIPLKGSGQLVGIVFEIPFTSVSVSARIFIDYDNCKYISDIETSAPSTSASSSIEPTASSGNTYTYSYPYALKQPTSSTGSGSAGMDYGNTDDSSLSDETSSEKTNSKNDNDKKEVTTSASRSESDNGNTGVIIGGIVLGVIILGLAAWAIIVKTKEGKR